jgi:ectoine hydroxylase-related dioxygenase (phytanoyl-CoA dioxygenase family)
MIEMTEGGCLLPISEIDALTRLHDGRTFSECRAAFDKDGYLIFKGVLPADEVQRQRDALSSYLSRDIRGRNEFEGLKSNRVYAMLAKSEVFASLITHPLALAFVESDLGYDCLLSACLAINLQPGETAQPWHYDDSHYGWPRPRPSLGVSTFWAIDETTAFNGATEIIPGSHLWADDAPDGALEPDDFSKTQGADSTKDAGARADAVKAVMPPRLANGCEGHALAPRRR